MFSLATLNAACRTLFDRTGTWPTKPERDFWLDFGYFPVSHDELVMWARDRNRDTSADRVYTLVFFGIVGIAGLLLLLILLVIAAIIW